MASEVWCADPAPSPGGEGGGEGARQAVACLGRPLRPRALRASLTLRPLPPGERGPDVASEVWCADPAPSWGRGWGEGARQAVTCLGRLLRPRELRASLTLRPLPRGEGTGSALGGWVRPRWSRVGVWGRTPTEGGAGRSPAAIEDGWAGESRAQRVLVRDGGMGRSPHRQDVRLPSNARCPSDIRRAPPSPPPSPSGRGGRSRSWQLARGRGRPRRCARSRGPSPRRARRGSRARSRPGRLRSSASRGRQRRRSRRQDRAC